MSAKESKYGRFFRLILFFYLLISLYFFLFSNIGFFLFKAGYDELKIWYPNYYNEIYFLLNCFHVTIIVALIYLLWNLIRHFRDFTKIIKNIIAIVKEEKNKLLHGGEENGCKPKYVIHFWSFQTTLLLIALAIYYSNISFKDNSSSFFFQLYLTRAYVLIALNGIAVFFWYNRKYFISKTVKFFFSPATPYNLAVYRIVFFLLLAKEYLVYLGGKTQFIESKPREALPFIGWLIDIMPISKELYYSACIAGVVCCIFLSFGLFTRLFLFINVFLVFYIISVPNFYGKLWHSQLSIWISWFLLFAPVSDVFSLDRLFFRRNQPLTKSSDYNFPLKIIWLQIGLIYFWAGFHKLSDGGFDWALSQSMINQVRLEWFESFDKLPFFRIDLYPCLLYAGGMTVIYFEIGFIAFLFHSRLKYISIIGGILMHNMLSIFMYIGFRELQLQYIVFINFENVLLYLKKKFPIIPIREKIETVNSSIRKTLVTFSFFIIAMNVIFGLFQISSFPFSVYPTYVEIIPSEKEYLHYSIKDRDKENIDMWLLGKQRKFNWESFARLEYAIIRKYNETSRIDTQAINNQWKWWSAHLPELSNIDTIDVYIYKRPLNPDSANFFSRKEFLITIYPNKN